MAARGSDGRRQVAFAERSIFQHRVMFARFHRYLVSRRTTLTAFGANDIDGFFSHLERVCKPGTSTLLLYLKLIDRLTRHVTVLKLRTDNPAATLLTRERWPENESRRLFSCRLTMMRGCRLSAARTRSNHSSRCAMSRVSSPAPRAAIMMLWRNMP